MEAAHRRGEGVNCACVSDPGAHRDPPAEVSSRQRLCYSKNEAGSGNAVRRGSGGGECRVGSGERGVESGEWGGWGVGSWGVGSEEWGASREELVECME